VARAVDLGDFAANDAEDLDIGNYRFVAVFGRPYRMPKARDVLAVIARGEHRQLKGDAVKTCASVFDALSILFTCQRHRLARTVANHCVGDQFIAQVEVALVPDNVIVELYNLTGSAFNAGLPIMALRPIAAIILTLKVSH
jgi:hypothetical protein